MKAINCFFVTPPGNLCIRLEGGEIRRATEREIQSVSQLTRKIASVYRWPKPTPNAQKKAALMAV